jgi:hypothetical protein
LTLAKLKGQLATIEELQGQVSRAASRLEAQKRLLKVYTDARNSTWGHLMSLSDEQNAALITANTALEAAGTATAARQSELEAQLATAATEIATAKDENQRLQAACERPLRAFLSRRT